MLNVKQPSGKQAVTITGTASQDPHHSNPRTIQFHHPGAASDSNGDACTVDARPSSMVASASVVACGIRASCARAVVATAHATIVKLQTRSIVCDGFRDCNCRPWVSAPRSGLQFSIARVECIACIQASSRNGLHHEISGESPIQDAVSCERRQPWLAGDKGRWTRVCTRRACTPMQYTCGDTGQRSSSTMSVGQKVNTFSGAYR